MEKVDEEDHKTPQSADLLDVQEKTDLEESSLLDLEANNLSKDRNCHDWKWGFECDHMCRSELQQRSLKILEECSTKQRSGTCIKHPLH